MSRKPRGGRQPRKDNDDKRINLDNERENKFEAKFDKKGNKPTRAVNDVSWYAHSPELLKSAASLPFSATTGLDIQMADGNAVPGVMGLYWHPTIGPNLNDFAPINQAANSVYSFTVHANSRNQSYDAPDEMILILAGASLFSFLSLGIRAYGTMRYYDQRNAYLPKALVAAMGFDYDDLRDNLAKMWFDLNELISRSRQIWIPNTMPVIERWFWLNGNIYKDGNSIKSQYYVFAPRVVWKYDETTYTTGGALVDSGWNSMNTNTWATYLTIANQLFDALLGSQDRGIIFGDILKAFGEDRLYTVSEIPSDYMVEPAFDTEVLTQIENSTTCRILLQDVSQDANGILRQPPQLGTTGPDAVLGDFLPCKGVLNFHTPEVPTPEQIMVATRLMGLSASWTRNGTDYYSYPVAIGTEYIYMGKMYYNNLSTGLQSKYFRTTGQGMQTDLLALAVWSSFDWSPWIYQYSAAPTVAAAFNSVADHAWGDFDNYTIVDRDTLLKMHTAAVYSEFGVPTM